MHAACHGLHKVGGEQDVGDEGEGKWGGGEMEAKGREKGEDAKDRDLEWRLFVTDRNANGAEIEISSRFGRKRRFYDIKQRFRECC